MYKLYFLLILHCLVPLAIAKEHTLPIKVKAKHAVLMNSETGEVLYGKNHEEKIFPASTTKMATLLYAYSKLKLSGFDQIVTIQQQDLTRVSEKYKVSHNFEVPAFWLEFDGKHYGLIPGEKIALKTLFHILMLESSNDVANAIASYLSKDLLHFSDKLNHFLLNIGCVNTHFLNPHGLYHPNHYTTSYDLALMAKEAMKHDFIREIVSKTEYTCPPTNKSKERTIKQSNKLLHPGKFYYPKAKGIKTGYTRIAGFNLVAYAEDENRKLIAVVNNSQDDFQTYRDVIHMFDTAFAEQSIKRRLFNQSESIQYIDIRGANARLKAKLKKDIIISYFPSEAPTITVKQNWFEHKLPIHKGDIVGEIKILNQNHQVIAKTSYLALNDLHETALAKFFRLFIKMMMNIWLWIILFLLIFSIGFFKRFIYSHMQKWWLAIRS